MGFGSEPIDVKGRLIAEKATEEDGFGRGLIVDTYWDVPSLFSPFVSLPSPEPLISAANSCGTAMSRLVYSTVIDSYPDDGDQSYQGNPSFDAIDSISGETSNWIGQAADSFEQAYQVPAKRVIPNQFLVVRCMKQALEAQADLWKTTHDSIHQIANSTMGALEVVNDKGPAEWEFALTVAAAVVGVGVTIASGGGAGPIVLTVAAGAFSSGAVAAGNSGDEKPEDKSKYKVSGDSPKEIVSSMRTAISQLVSDTYTAEEKIRKGMVDLTAAINGDGDHPDSRNLGFVEPLLVRTPEFGAHV